MIGMAQKIKRDIRQARWSELSQEYKALFRKLSYELDVTNQIRIQRQIGELESQMDRLEQEIKGLEYKFLEDRLHKIDFREIDEMVRNSIGEIGDSPRYALLLLQNSRDMGGDWCNRMVKEYLESTTGHFRYSPTEPLPGGRLGQWGVLDRLADAFMVERADGDLAEYAQKIIRAICAWPRMGSVIFIELRAWEYYIPRDRVLVGFVNDFWVPLVRELPAGATIVIALVAEYGVGRLPQILFCTREQFNGEKILELPLRNWERHEIQAWLRQYAGLPRSSLVDQIAAQIYTESQNGIPDRVHKLLIANLDRWRGGE
jgi:hypothetical protein